MTKEKFLQARKKLDVSQTTFADLLGYEGVNAFQTVLRKEKGRLPITRQDEIIIKYLLLDHKNENKS